MTELLGLINVRTQISKHLTGIFELFGNFQLKSDVRKMPIVVSDVLSMIDELELIEKKYYGFSELFAENIHDLKKHSAGIITPPILFSDPSVKSLRAALYELTSPLIERYCEDEKQFLSSAAESLSHVEWVSALKETRQNCELLFAWCLPGESILLLDLKLWCNEQINDLRQVS